MPILYVNPARFSKRGKKPRIGKLRRKARKGMPPALAAYWKGKRSAKKARRKARRVSSVTSNPTPRRKKRKAKLGKKRSRSTQMAKRKKRRKGSKKTRRRGRRTAAKLGWRRRRKKSGGRKRTRSRRRKKRSKSRRKGRRRGRKSRARAARLGHRRRKRKPVAGPIYRRSKAGRGGTRRGMGPITFVTPNPSRKRRRKGRRRGRRTAARLGWRRRRKKRGSSRRRKSRRRGRRTAARYRRVGRLGRRSIYVKNPGGMLMALAKRVAPIVLATIGAKAIANRIGPRIPMLDRLGAFQGPAVAILTVLGAHYATKKISFLAKHRDSIMIGTGIAAVTEVMSALLPSSIKGMLGMGDVYTEAMADYIATNDYEQVADGMSDYVAVGALEQELGLDQELGFTAEMGDAFGQGGLGGARSGLAPVPARKFLAPVPPHSFTQTVPEMNDEYDNPAVLYSGIFRGGGS